MWTARSMIGSLDDWFVKLGRVRPALIAATDGVLTELGV